MQGLTTRRLTLGNLRTEDTFALYRYRSLSIVEKYQSWKHYSYDEASALVKRVKDQHFDGQPGVYQWGIYLNGFLIGDIFWQIEQDRTCWLGYTLDPHYWHQGYAYEALKAFTDWLAYQYGMTRQMAYILKDNQASIALISKLGFRLLYPQVYLKDHW